MSDEIVSKPPNTKPNERKQGGVYLYPSPLFFIPCGLDGDSIDSIDGSDHMYLSRDRKSYRVVLSMEYMMPKYEDCHEGFQSLVDCVEDLDSPTFRDIWFECARQLRQKGCWEQCSNLMKVARAHDRGSEVNPKQFHIYRINRCSSNNMCSSSILSKEENK